MIKQFRMFTGCGLCDMCEEHGFYTCGTNAEYSAMLSVDHRTPTPKRIEAIARDILKHSSEEINAEYRLVDVMNIIEQDCVSVWYAEEE